MKEPAIDTGYMSIADRIKMFFGSPNDTTDGGLIVEEDEKAPKKDTKSKRR